MNNKKIKIIKLKFSKSEFVLTQYPCETAKVTLFDSHTGITSTLGITKIDDKVIESMKRHLINQHSFRGEPLPDRCIEEVVVETE